MILVGDSRETLKELADSSVDSCVCDPPYELGFMGKAWDSTGIAYDVGLWREVLRVLKPGGHLLAFGGTRTHHRMVCAIEDAGFEIRDEIQWLYGSGFPKSLDVSKAIDKAAGAEREVVGQRKPEGSGVAGQAAADSTGSHIWTGNLTSPIGVTPEAQQWDGWGTALKPACEPICVARKPLEGTVSQNVLKHGTGGINVDGCRVEWKSQDDLSAQARAFSPNSTAWTGGHNDKAGTANFACASKGPANPTNPQGRWPANVILSHAEGCVCTGTKRVKGSGKETQPRGTGGIWSGESNAPSGPQYADADGLETVEAWQCVEGCPVRLLDEQSGECPSGGGNKRPTKVSTFNASPKHGRFDGGANIGGDTGGASRFFYTAKASKSDREHFNTHATVKPLALMRYLVRLVTPPGGTVLDWCAGSGTTLVAARQEGFKFIGCELDKAHADIIRRRLELELPFA